MRSPAWIALLLVAGVFAVFYPVARHEFVHYDDYEYVIQNAQLRDGLGDAVRGAFRPYAANWIPLTWMSLWLDFSLYGLEPAGYHLTNVALHALSCVLLFLALARMTGAIWRSAFVAAVFAIHPLHVESVAWASERKDTLSGAFWMLTLWSYARYSERPGSVRSYLLVLLCLSLGLLAKPVVVTLPFALLLLDYWPLGRLRGSDASGWPQAVMLRRALVEKLPMFALVAMASVATLVAQREMGAMHQMEDLSVTTRVANAAVSYTIYLWKAVWPSGLAVFYPHPLEGIVDWRPVAALGLLIATTAVLMRAAAAHSYAVVGWLWYLGTLVPVIGFVQVGMQARADRYTYIPLIGLAILTAWGAVELAQRWRISLAALGAVAFAAIVALATTAWFQVGTWRDTDSMYRHALSVTEGNYVAHNGMGSELARQERFTEATWHYEEAVRMAPHWSTARLGLADVALASGRVEEAINALERELQRNPNDIKVIGRYGLALGLAGRFGEARHYIERALAVQKGIAELHRAMADVEAAQGNVRAAIHHGREALRLQPADLGAANNLAWVLATSRDPSLRDPHQAIQLLEGAARGSNDPWMLDTLAAAYASAGRFHEAVAIASRAADLAREQGADANLLEIRGRLALYQQSKPYVDPGPSAR